MFKSVRWRSDKNKIAVVFKLRFHATQVSQLGGNALVLSLVPADTGKQTAKLEKYEIQDGCCYWTNTILETVKFIQDPKTGKIQDKIYNCIISTGSSKSNVLGEVSLNITEYVEALKATSVSLPFKGSNSDITLHVLIQRVQENVIQRELEEHELEKINPADKSLKRTLSNGDTEENIDMDSTEEQHLKKTISNIAEQNKNRSGSIESDITLSSSDSSSGLNTPPEFGTKSSNMLLNTPTQQKTQWDLSLSLGHDSSTDDCTNSPSADAYLNGRSELALDPSVEKLKSYLVFLSRKAELSDLELQTLRKQIVKERKRGHDLLKEVACLKVERDALREECEKFRASQKGKDESNVVNSLALLEETRKELNHEKDLNVSMQLQLEKTQESNLELTLAVQDLKRMLEQRKRGNLDHSVMQVSSKIPGVLEGRFLNGQGLSDDDEEQKALEEIVKQHTEAKETYILEQRIMDLCSEIEMYRRDKDELEMQMEQLALDYEILKQENHDKSQKLDKNLLHEQLKLQYECSGSYCTTNEHENHVTELEKEFKDQSRELTGSLDTIKELECHVHNLAHELDEQAQEFRDELQVAARMEKEQQSICAEEALRSANLELENQMKKLKSDLKQKSEEHSDALATIKELEDQIQNLGDELDKQVQGFESDLEALTHAKVEQEQRAIRAEEALRLTRWKNANTAGRIQDEFKRLSVQMQSTFEANEKVATKAMTEASELRLINSHLEELLQQAKEELQLVKDDHEAQVNDLHNQLILKSEQNEEILNQLNHHIEQEDEICQSLSTELLILRVEVDKLTSDTASLAARIEHGEDLKSELGQVKALVDKRDSLVWRVKMERENLEFPANEDADESLEELNKINYSKNDNNDALLNLQSEANKLDKEKPREQVLVERANACSEECTSELTARVSEEANHMKEKTKILEGHIKQKENALEKDYDKIEELNYSSTTYCEYNGNADGFESSDDSYKPVNNTFETSTNRVKENAIQLSSLTMKSGDEYELYGLLTEMASLREKNTSMENELQEMQSRYSEMSVKFAEVEGDRQMLIMTLRSVKNVRKI